VLLIKDCAELLALNNRNDLILAKCLTLNESMCQSVKFLLMLDENSFGLVVLGL